MTDDAKKLIFKREDLFEQIWNIPVTQLAKQFGISDTGLAKICRKLNVPRPPVGFWAKVANGKKVSRPDLPTLKPGEPAEYACYQAQKSRSSIDIGDQFKDIPQVTKAIVVPEHLETPHPLVRHTRAILRKMKPDDYGMLSPHGEKCLALRIGPASVGRALIILDTVLKEFKSQKFPVSTDTAEKIASRVEIAGEKIPFTLVEEARRIDHVLTDKEKLSQNAGSIWHIPKWDYVPTGRLSLMLEAWGAPGCRKQWSDSSNKRLEEKLGDFINGAVLAAHVTKAESLRREEESKKWEEERKKREEVERLQAAEEERLRNLEKQAESWAKSEQLRSFVKAAEGLVAEKQLPDESRQRLEKWIIWAKEHAERLDPLRELRSKRDI